jgi:hypothetical protein
MTNIALILTGVIVGLAMSGGRPSFCAPATREQTRGSAVAAVSGLVFGLCREFSSGHSLGWTPGSSANLRSDDWHRRAVDGSRERTIRGPVSSV